MDEHSEKQTQNVFYVVVYGHTFQKKTILKTGLLKQSKPSQEKLTKKITDRRIQSIIVYVFGTLPFGK